jgi:hypothetical protein
MFRTINPRETWKPAGEQHDQIREPMMILLTMGFKTDDFLDQPFKTQNDFQNDQISLSNS